MISKNVEALLNAQMNAEMASANLYLQMASYFMDMELTGFAHFFELQAQEEHNHMMLQFKYLHDVGGRLRLGAIPAPQQEFDSPLTVVKLAYDHEKKVTESIHNLVDEALKAKDYATYTFLEWFVKEQVEEEATMQNIAKRLEMVADNQSALFLLDQELGQRTAAGAKK